MNRSYVFLANGFEEIEALTVVDVMRRAGLEVQTVSINKDNNVIGAHGVTVVADTNIYAANFEDAEWLIAPGGMPGSQNLHECKKLNDILSKKHLEKMIADGKDEKTAEKAAKKKAQEDARYVLSNACDTKLVMTMNVRSLYHFFNLRCCERAQWEIREMATQMLKLVKEVSPVLFENAGPSCVSGPCAEGGMSCGKAAAIREKFKNL